jgi:hypothetical protein
MEADLVRGADVVVAASEALRDRLAAMGREAYVLTHGVDVPHWSGGGAGPIPELDGLERPLVVFWGVIDRRLDVRFLERLAADLEGGTIVLAGPEQDPDPRLRQIGRLARVGPIPFDRLPRLAREASVLIMPYADLPVTRAMQPLKLKEYLATGRPAVVADLPATRPWSDCLDLASTPESFSLAVRARIAAGLPGCQAAARVRLGEEAWAAKALAFERWALGPSPHLDQQVRHEELAR